MKQSKDPFEAAFEAQEESPLNSPVGAEENEAQNEASLAVNDRETDSLVSINHPEHPSTSFAATVLTGTAGKPKEDDEEEEEEHMDVQLGKFTSSTDPDKKAKMQSILSQFTEEQMSRYESFRRSGFQKSNMKRLLVSITGSQKISVPMTIVMSGIAKMFVGELIETARIVMSERNDTGPIRPCHVREVYRRLKLEGKVPKRSVSRNFR
ncbi:transcription initiation factor TFIID subunit 11-like [Ipomoea triloba]|uniref:transcription initiation factor TFIID subunit 11-like n=1 Tax=Ipomoea triloba TaxID=35885 RepID=UPI00125E35F4|nr:transcription initiation factor TFIID subunit 11-like [Ipomoea triloba]XP_031111335.1 transcription initiation factor TFIID subunit 11-like [Ipomoea triloba]XP_031111336.1 transcription initiation factor TFIID subunit 11-like [Ipomoea triloba]XP_031111337.1 transcription initiation factor TFIID subunit 11-like [Ipomoea triloba]